MPKNTLLLLKMYQGKGENEKMLQIMLRRLEAIKTWGGLKGFINLSDDRNTCDFMMYPIRFIERTSADALLPDGKPNWKTINRFKKDFTRQDGSFRWPITDETELTRRHLGAIRSICSHPYYGRQMWDSHAIMSMRDGKEDATHFVGLMLYKALYLTLPELPKKEGEK